MIRTLVVPLLILLFATLSACRGADRTAPEAEPVAASPPPQTTTPAAAGSESGAAALTKASVRLYFPSANDDGLAVETREIFDTKRPADRGVQILAALLAGPQTPGALPAFPEGTTLRQLWVEDDGNAFVDFSPELASHAGAGSADELLTVYAIVDSLTQNVSEIRRVGILVAGSERDTLGHVDIRRPLPADLSYAQQAKATE